MAAEERGRVTRRDDIFIDVGAVSRQDAEERLGIRPGDPIAPDSRFAVLNGGPLYVGKAWDDRAGVGVMIEVMRRLKANPPAATVFATATVQEEIGLRGAHTASYIVKPDIGISLEAGVSADFPGISADEAQERLGRGPGMFLHDSTMLPNLKLRDLFIDVARKKFAAAVQRPERIRRRWRGDAARLRRYSEHQHHGSHALPAQSQRHHPPAGLRPRGGFGDGSDSQQSCKLALRKRSSGA